LWRILSPHCLVRGQIFGRHLPCDRTRLPTLGHLGHLLVLRKNLTDRFQLLDVPAALIGCDCLSELVMEAAKGTDLLDDPKPCEVGQVTHGRSVVGVNQPGNLTWLLVVKI
jgi:hypothetical protein